MQILKRSDKDKITYKAIAKYRYGLWKALSKHLNLASYYVYYVLTPSPNPRPFKISTTRALREKNGGNALIVLENQNCI